jgi:predicted anti-sigma-YlaC factor YlaD
MDARVGRLQRNLRNPAALLPLVLAAALASGGCSVKTFAINRLGDALASGGSTYESDDDPELIGEALPFSLKLVESLLAESPRHRGLRLAACKGFTAYAYAYVHQPADFDGANDLAWRDAEYARARRLYLRATRHGLEGLAIDLPGLGERLRMDPSGAVADARREHVPLLYWTAASLGLAISLSVDEAAMLGRLREVDALIDRALALDEGWQEGTLHEFALTLEGSRPPGTSREASVLRMHFERALALSHGRRASLYVTAAEAVAVNDQDVGGFRSLLSEALSLDPDGVPELRLATLHAQRRARWLLERERDLFLTEDAPVGAGGVR